MEFHKTNDFKSILCTFIYEIRKWTTLCQSKGMTKILQSEKDLPQNGLQLSEL